MSETVRVLPLGRVPYADAWALQKALHRRLIAQKRAGERPDHLLLLVEHPHVYTLGQNGRREHLLASDADLEAMHATFVPVDRGGDITYHGPGQLVGYPLLDLERFKPDLHDYLRRLEETTIRTLAAYGVAGGRVPGRTGVWVGPDEHGPERKICAFGIRCARWVTMHGWALNLNADLAMFDAIVPCGIADRGVTSLARETGRDVDEAEATDRMLDAFADVFDARLVRHRPDEAWALVNHAAGETNGIVAEPAR